MDDLRINDDRLDSLPRAFSLAPPRRPALRLLLAAALSPFGLPRVAEAHDALPAFPQSYTGPARGTVTVEALGSDSAHRGPWPSSATAGLAG